METKDYRTKLKTHQPWYINWIHARSRCVNKNNERYKYYGGRGIKFDLGFWAMGVLYWRDNAEKMDKPSIDRIDNDGDYTFQNCRFIEHKENTRLGSVGRKSRLGQFHTEEAKEKIRKANIGRVVPKHIREKISKTLKQRKNNGNKV